MSFKFCPECGFKFDKAYKFCPECGYRLDGTGGKSASSEPLFDFSEDTGAYAGLDGFDKMLSKPSADEEKKTAKLKKLSAFEYEEHADGTFAILALKYNSVVNIEVPEGVTSILPEVFMGKDIISVALPQGLIQIGDRAFKDCKNLMQINFPKSLMIVGNEAFAGCESLDAVLPSTVKKVGRDAMKNTLPDIDRQREEAIRAEKAAARRREEERRRAEEEAARKKAEEEARKKREAEEAARKKAEAEAKKKREAEERARKAEAERKRKAEEEARRRAEELAWAKANLELRSNGNGTYEVTGVQNFKITSAVIPDCVTKIGWYAFGFRDNLASVTMTNSVKVIEREAFQYCTYLRSITLSNSITEIKGGTFCDCRSLTSIVIPYGVTLIDRFAFSRCTSLTSITIPDSVKEIRWGAFKDCTSLRSVSIPSGCSYKTKDEGRDYPPTFPAGCTIIRR